MVRPLKIMPLGTVPVCWLDAINPPPCPPRQHQLPTNHRRFDEASFRQQRDWDDSSESLTRWETYVVPYPDLLHGEVPRLPVLASAHQRVELLDPAAAAATPMGRLWLRLLSLGCGPEFQSPDPLLLPDSYLFR